MSSTFSNGVYNHTSWRLDSENADRARFGLENRRVTSEMKTTLNMEESERARVADPIVSAVFDRFYFGPPDKAKPKVREDGAREWVPLSGIVLTKSW